MVLSNTKKRKLVSRSGESVELAERKETISDTNLSLSIVISKTMDKYLVNFFLYEYKKEFFFLSLFSRASFSQEGHRIYNNNTGEM